MTLKTTTTGPAPTSSFFTLLSGAQQAAQDVDDFELDDRDPAVEEPAEQPVGKARR